MTNSITDKLLTSEDCCRLLGVTRATLQRFIKIGRFAKSLDLPYQRKYWQQSDVDNFFASSGVKVDAINATNAMIKSPDVTHTVTTAGNSFSDYVSKIIQDKRKQFNIK